MQTSSLDISLSLPFLSLAATKKCGDSSSLNWPFGGRLCLPAEEFLDQSFECGFSLVAAAGLEGGGVLEGEAAFRSFERVSRPPEAAPGVSVAHASQTAS